MDEMVIKLKIKNGHQNLHNVYMFTKLVSISFPAHLPTMCIFYTTPSQAYLQEVGQCSQQVAAGHVRLEDVGRQRGHDL